MKGIAIALALVLAGCPASTPSPPPDVPRQDPPTEEPADEPASRTSFELDGHRLVLPGPIVFGGLQQSELDTAASATALAHVLAFLNDRTDVTMVRIEGHSAGDSGEDDVMMTGQRALNVGYWLMKQGVACERLMIAGFGGSKPIAADGAADNVRIEVVVATLRGHAIDGMDPGGNAPAAVPACD